MVVPLRRDVAILIAAERTMVNGDCSDENVCEGRCVDTGDHGKSRHIVMTTNDRPPFRSTGSKPHPGPLQSVGRRKGTRYGYRGRCGATLAQAIREQERRSRRSARSWAISIATIGSGAIVG